ncbi:MAG: restriction endonuclease subunit S, partial [Coriobacteriales bacterium]|nr:restriction endonuclease subunit S [Coriobacteriales bacterium]
MGYNTVCLGDVVNFYSGGTPSKKNPDYWDGDIPWVSAKAMDADGINNNVLHISEDGLAAGSRLADTGSILFLTRGSGLFTRIPVIWVYSPVAYNQDIKCLKAKNQNDARYIYHWLTSQRSIFTKSLDVTGIGAGKINTDQLQRMQIFWPSEAERQRIVLLADPLITAVHLNKRTNDYL